MRGLPVNMQVINPRFSKSTTKYPLVLILGILCLFSYLSTASYPHQAFKSTKLLSAVAAKQHSSSHLSNARLSNEYLWLHENIIEEEDDDTKQRSNAEFKHCFVDSGIYTEFFFSSYLRTCLRQLDLKKAAHPFIAYFVLYHSWKSDLS